MLNHAWTTHSEANVWQSHWVLSYKSGSTILLQTVFLLNRNLVFNCLNSDCCFIFPDIVRKTETLNDVLKIPGHITCQRNCDTEQRSTYPWMLSPVHKVSLQCFFTHLGYMVSNMCFNLHFFPFSFLLLASLSVLLTPPSVSLLPHFHRISDLRLSNIYIFF